MNVEVKLALESAQHTKESTTNTNNDEVLVMNYDDYNEDAIFEDIAKIPDFISEECARSYGNGIQTVSNNLEVKVDDEELCDVDTKQNILVKFEENNDKTQEGEGNKKIQDVKYGNKKLICYQCGFRAAKKHHLQNHILQGHQKKKKVRTDFACEHCMFKTKYKPSLGLHMASFHMDKVLGEDNASPTKSCYEVQGTSLMDHCTLDKSNVYNCKYCSYATSSKNLMLHHSVVHTVHKSEVFQCPKCPKKFTKQALQVHMVKVHNPEGIFNCPNCSYTTKWRNNLRRHFKQNKNSEVCKPFVKRRSAEQMKQERLEGKASPKKRRRNTSDSDRD